MVNMSFYCTAMNETKLQQEEHGTSDGHLILCTTCGSRKIKSSNLKSAVFWSKS